MKFPSIELLQLVGTRLGFGSLEPGASIVTEPPSSEIDEQGLSTAGYPAPPPPDPNWLSARPLAAHEELAYEFGRQQQQQQPTAVLEQPDNREPEGSGVGRLLAQLSFSTAFHESPEAQQPSLPLPLNPLNQPPATSTRAGRALVVGFPTGQRPRLQQILGQHLAGEIEFLPLESLPDRTSEAASAALLLLNIASVTVVQRNRKELLDLIAAGRPVLLTGSRVAMKQLGIDGGEDANWDFQPVPWDPDEMTWRVRKLLQNSQPQAAQAPTPPVAARRIVIADHDPITRSLVESTLALPGIVSVSATEDGEAALERVRELRPDVLVMDLSLPNRDGFQLLAEIKRSKDLQKTRVIVLTARQAELDILRAFGLGADDYVTKPFSPLELRARVQRLIVRGGAE